MFMKSKKFLFQIFLLLLSSVCYAANDKLNGGNNVLPSSPVDNPGRGCNNEFCGMIRISSFFRGNIIFNGDECLLVTYYMLSYDTCKVAACDVSRIKDYIDLFYVEKRYPVIIRELPEEKDFDGSLHGEVGFTISPLLWIELSVNGERIDKIYTKEVFPGNRKYKHYHKDDCEYSPQFIEFYSFVQYLTAIHVRRSYLINKFKDYLSRYENFMNDNFNIDTSLKVLNTSFGLMLHLFPFVADKFLDLWDSVQLSVGDDEVPDIRYFDYFNYLWYIFDIFDPYRLKTIILDGDGSYVYERYGL